MLVKCFHLQFLASGPSRSLAHGSCGIVPPWLSFVLLAADHEGLSDSSTVLDSSGTLHVSSPWPGLFVRATRGLDDVSFNYFDGNGFYRLNDYGYVRSLDAKHQVLCVEGRSDDVINSNGVRIAPGELEQIANSFEEILESCCVGLPDETRGSSIVLVLSFLPPPSKEGLLYLFSLIQKRIHSILGSFYVPHLVFSTSSLPKTPSGKIVRHVVRSKLIDLFSNGSFPNGDTITF